MFWLIAWAIESWLVIWLGSSSSSSLSYDRFLKLAYLSMVFGRSFTHWLGKYLKFRSPAANEKTNDGWTVTVWPLLARWVRSVSSLVTWKSLNDREGDDHTILLPSPGIAVCLLESRTFQILFIFFSSFRYWNSWYCKIIFKGFSLFPKNSKL